MGIAIGIGLVIASIIGAAISQQLTDEFKAWTPWLLDFLIRRAVNRLPEEARERLNEEWRAHLSDVPGQAGKLIAAVGLVRAANIVHRETAANKIEHHASKTEQTNSNERPNKWGQKSEILDEALLREIRERVARDLEEVFIAHDNTAANLKAAMEVVAKTSRNSLKGESRNRKR